MGSQVQKLCALNRFYQTLVEKGHLMVNLAARLPMPKMDQRMPKALPSVADVERMLRRTPIRTPRQFRDRAILELFYATGVRQAELSHLKTTDVDLARREIYVIGKGLKDRTLVLTHRCTDCLRVYLRQVRQLLPKGQYLFPTKSGRRLEAKSLLDLVDLAARNAKLKSPMTTHTFRHLLATELLRRGAPMRSIQEYLGHGSVETTTRYAQVLGKDLKAVHCKTHPRERDLNCERS